MIENLNDLKKLIALCQKQGVDSIKIGDIEIKLGTPPMKESKKSGRIEHLETQEDSFMRAAYAQASANTQIQTDGWESLTEEQRLFYSTGPGEGQ